MHTDRTAEDAEIERLAREQRHDDTSKISRERAGAGGQPVLTTEILNSADLAEPPASPKPMIALARDLIDAIDALPDQQRDVINALFYERLTEAAAAERYGISRALVRKRRDQALLVLRQVLGGATAELAS